MRLLCQKRMVSCKKIGVQLAFVNTFFFSSIVGLSFLNVTCTFCDRAI